MKLAGDQALANKLTNLLIGAASLFYSCPGVCAEIAPPPYVRTGFREVIAGEQWAYGEGSDARHFAEIGRSGERVSLQGREGKRIDLYPGHARELLAGNVWEIWPNDPAWTDTSDIALAIGDTFILPGFHRDGHCIYPRPTFRTRTAQGATVLAGDGRSSPTVRAHSPGTNWIVETEMVKIGDQYDDFLALPANQTDVVLTVSRTEKTYFSEQTEGDATCGEFWISLLPPDMSLTHLKTLLPGITQSFNDEELFSEGLADLNSFIDEETNRLRDLSPAIRPESVTPQTNAQLALGQWHPAILGRSSLSVTLVEAADLEQLEQMRLVAERTFGRSSPISALVRTRLEGEYTRSDELVKALRVIEEKLAIAESQDDEGMGSYWTESARSSLALHWVLLDKYANAEVEYRKALAIAQARKSHSVENIQMDLADAIARQGRHAEAEGLFDAAIESLSGKSDPDEDAIQLARSRRAEWRYYRRDCAAAEVDFSDLREIAASSAAPDEEYIDELDLNLAFARMCQGYNAEAKSTLEALRDRAGNNAALLSVRTALLEALYRDRDLDRADSEVNAILTWAKGKDVDVPGFMLMKINAGLLSRKIDSQLRGLIAAQIASTEVDIRQRSWQRDSESRMQMDPKAIRNATWTFARQARDASSARLAALESLLFKDVATDISAKIGTAGAIGSDPEVAQMRNALQSAAAKLSFSAVNPEANLDASRLKAVYGRLEQALIDRLKEDQSVEAPSVETLQRSLGDRILLDFRVFRDIEAQPYEWLTNPFDDEQPASRNLGVVVVNAASVDFVDLGSWAPVLAAISSYRAAIGNRDAVAADNLSKELFRLIWAPLTEHIRSDATVLISADAELSFVPFLALRNSSGQYLIEGYTIQSVGAARDLLKSIAYQAALGPALLVYSPAYWLAEKPRRNATRFEWTPLPGVQSEGLEIERILRRGARTLETRVGKEATETVLRAAKRPALLHIATHGYSWEPASTASSKERGAFIASASFQPPGPLSTTSVTDVMQPSSAVSFVLDRNPLLRSGLVLAGANDAISGLSTPNVSSSVDDGLLTALEVQTLDLQGTELVVLSACETGIGEFRSGSGVASLQRSFLFAGADSVVYSLWKVDDAATRVLMNRLYTSVMDGLGANVALRAAQLSMLKDESYQAPWMWAAFVGTPSRSTSSPATADR